LNARNEAPRIPSAAYVASEAITIPQMLISKLMARCFADMGSFGNPSNAANPNHVGTIATCAVAASPIISRRPTSSLVASPAATPTTSEINKPVTSEFAST